MVAHSAIDHTGITGVGGGSSSFVGAKVYHSTTQSIPDASSTALTFDSEEFDTDAFHAGGAPTRLTIPAGKDGKYLLVGGGIQAASASPALSQIFWRLNGTTVIRGTTTAWVPSSTQTTGFGSSTIADLVAGDYVELMFYQDSSGARNVNADCTAMITFLGA